MVLLVLTVAAEIHVTAFMTMFHSTCVTKVLSPLSLSRQAWNKVNETYWISLGRS